MCQSSILNVDTFALLEIPTALLQLLHSLDAGGSILVESVGLAIDEHENLKLGRTIVRLLTLLLQHHTSQQTLATLVSLVQAGVYPHPPLLGSSCPVVEEERPLLGWSTAMLVEALADLVTRGSRAVPPHPPQSYFALRGSAENKSGQGVLVPRCPGLFQKEGWTLLMMVRMPHLYERDSSLEVPLLHLVPEFENDCGLSVAIQKNKGGELQLTVTCYSATGLTKSEACLPLRAHLLWEEWTCLNLAHKKTGHVTLFMNGRKVDSGKLFYPQEPNDGNCMGWIATRPRNNSSAELNAGSGAFKGALGPVAFLQKATEHLDQKTLYDDLAKASFRFEDLLHEGGNASSAEPASLSSSQISRTLGGLFSYGHTLTATLSFDILTQFSLFILDPRLVYSENGHMHTRNPQRHQEGVSIQNLVPFMVPGTPLLSQEGRSCEAFLLGTNESMPVMRVHSTVDAFRIGGGSCALRLMSTLFAHRLDFRGRDGGKRGPKIDHESCVNLLAILTLLLDKVELAAPLLSLDCSGYAFYDLFTLANVPPHLHTVEFIRAGCNPSPISRVVFLEICHPLETIFRPLSSLSTSHPQ
jgi:hypothetical protein